MSVAADRRTRFDRAYYQRYYFDPHTAVASRSEMRARARLIAALVAHMGLPVRRILEAGCGTGMLRTELRRLLPRAHYVALESSEYLCRRYGYLHGRIEEYRARSPTSGACAAECCISARSPATTTSATATGHAPTPMCTCAAHTGIAPDCAGGFARWAWGSGCGVARH